MDASPDRRQIWFGLAAVLALTGFSLAAALIFPFKVEQAAAITGIQGSVSRIERGGDITPLDPDQRAPLEIGTALRLEPGSTAQITFDLDGGQAVLTGPVELRLNDSYRRATGLGHVLDRPAPDYALVLEQSLGMVRYDFSHTDPPFEAVEITIRLPGKNYTPAAPCWSIAVDPTGGTVIDESICPP